MIEKFPICFDRVSLHSISKLLRKLEKATTWQKSSTSNVSKYFHAWMMINIFLCILQCSFLYLIFDIWYLIFIRKLKNSCILLSSAQDVVKRLLWWPLSAILIYYSQWAQIHNPPAKGKKLHYQTTFVWTIIIGLNSMFPLFPALSLNYVSFIVLSKPDSFIIDLRRWLKSRHPD